LRGTALSKTSGGATAPASAATAVDDDFGVDLPLGFESCAVGALALALFGDFFDAGVSVFLATFARSRCRW
jgi:hypothetical protein